MKYYIIAGEASGDLHGSNLMKELRRLDPDVHFRCWGGDLMGREGGELVRHYRDLAFMGFLEVIAHLPAIAGNLRFCRKDLLSWQPDALILIDYPGFNLRMAKFAHSKGIRVFYYISPQLWAWKSSRVRIIRDNVEKMFVILPFEKEFYARHGCIVDFVGHPLLDVIGDDPDPAGTMEFRNSLSPDGKPIIALLPGSRKQEIRMMLKVMTRVIHKLPGYSFAVAGAPSVDPDFYDPFVQSLRIKVVFTKTYDLLRCSEAALVTSGTATLETALMNVPQVVCYKGSRLSFLVARRLVHVKYISLVNLIMDREIVKELIQDDLVEDNLYSELNKILENREIIRNMKDSYRQLKEKLGGPGASRNTAERILGYLNTNQKFL